MRNPMVNILIVLAITGLGTAARGEVFLLHNGGRIEGQWLNQKPEPPALYEIAISGGGRLTVSSDQVARVVVKSEALLRYEALLPSVPDTVEGHWEMAERCRKESLPVQRDLHLQRILEISPDHSDARHALGYSQVEGKWVKPDEWLTRQGYVRHKGSWRLPQEVELEARRELQIQEEQQWRKQLKIWRSSIIRGRSDSAEAMEKLRSTDSSFAIGPLAELLAESDEPKPLKLLYIDILGRLPSSNATAALLERVMTDPDLEIRERSLEAIKLHGLDQAEAFFCKHLQDKSNVVVNRAGWALGKLADPRAIPALIEAVVTKHKTTVYPGGAPGGINAGMGSGGGGLQMGGRPKVLEQESQNREVLAALTSLTPEGVNFGYNKAAWQNWWAQLHAAPDYDLRRDL